MRRVFFLVSVSLDESSHPRLKADADGHLCLHHYWWLAPCFRFFDASGVGLLFGSAQCALRGLAASTWVTTCVGRHPDPSCEPCSGRRVRRASREHHAQFSAESTGVCRSDARECRSLEQPYF